MTPEVVAQLVLTVGIVPALFVYLLFDTRREHREQFEKSQERERQLMEHISKSDETQREITQSISKISDTLNGMDKNMNVMQRDIEDLKRERD